MLRVIYFGNGLCVEDGSLSALLSFGTANHETKHDDKVYYKDLPHIRRNPEAIHRKFPGLRSVRHRGGSLWICANCGRIGNSSISLPGEKSRCATSRRRSGWPGPFSNLCHDAGLYRFLWEAGQPAVRRVSPILCLPLPHSCPGSSFPGRSRSARTVWSPISGSSLEFIFRELLFL